MCAAVVKSGTIIQRMLDELVQAKRDQDNVVEMTKHIENVKLLCEVILADSQNSSVSRHISVAAPQSNHDITEQEMKAMMIGQQTQTNKIQSEQLEQLRKQSSGADDDDGNSDSLFDF